uniref:Uncharacterized protein n=1 Tax=Globisporangium ultimum (strain ATCC 200006 / CBS 805.95 / DAOM BR144) TaxID=431595 RepID=K3WNY3_GLOUD
MERQTRPEDLPRHVRSDDSTRPFTAMGSSTVHLEALQTPSLGRKSSAGSVPHATRLESPGGEFDVRKFILDQKGSEPLHQSSLFRAAPFKEQPRPKSRNSTKGVHVAPENYPSSKKLLPRMDLKDSKSAGTLPTSVIGISSDEAERTNKVSATSTTGRGVSLNQEHDEEYDTVSHFYTIEKMAESCCHATQNRNKTWHFLPGSEERSKGNNGASGVVGSSITGVERPSRRVDVLDLEKCFGTAIKFVNRKNKWDVTCDEKLAMIDRDIMSIEARVTQKYTSASCDAQSERAGESLDDQKILVKLFFEQKWSDVILGELEAMLTVSFLEQGVVLRNARIQYAQAFFHLEQLYCARSKDLKQTLRDLERMRQQILQTSEDHQRDTIDMKEQYEAEIRRLNIGFEAHKEEMEKKVIESKEQMTKMGDTMKTLNTIFRQMREDTEKVKAVELRENYSKLEKKYELCREEIERLRPLIQVNHKLTDEKEAAEREIEALKEKMAHMDTILLSKDETIANLMEQQSDMLAAQELREAQEEERRKRAQDDTDDDDDGSNAPAVSSGSPQSPGESNEARSRQNSVAICIQCKQNMKDMFSQGGLADQENNSAQAAQATGENVDVGLLDQDRKAPEIKKRRIQCLYFRIMLPNLRGRQPHKDMAWTFSCMRSILFAKQIDDSMCRKNGGSFPLRIRMPEFVYSWFSPWRSIKDEKNQDEYGAGYADAGDSDNEHDSGPAAAASQPTLTPEQQQMQADENRWCLYYGVKALVQEGYLEAKLFLSLLDEKYGEDELVFMLYCYRVLDILIGGKLNWGPLRECVSYEKFCREFERSVATGVVLSKATESERAALDKKILDYVVTSVPEEEKPTIFLPPERPRNGRRLSNIRHGHHDAFQADQYNENDDNEDQAPQQFVDANLWVELMMLEYKEEQAHRRAAIRLMFQTATSSMGSLGTSSRLSDTREFVPAGGISAATMDIEQFQIMVRTLNDEIPSFMVAALFRNAYVKGNGVVNFDAFMDVAESAHWDFSPCRRTKPTNLCGYVNQLPGYLHS